MHGITAWQAEGSQKAHRCLKAHVRRTGHHLRAGVVPMCFDKSTSWRRSWL